MKAGLLPRALLAAALIVVMRLALSPAQAEVPVPPLKARVTDLTSTLNADQRAALERRLAQFEAQKGSQVAVLIVPTTKPEAIEQYSIRVVDRWQLGRKGVDDGVLLLVAKEDRELRIEVGRGLEGAIPDAYAKRIVEEDIVPHFKQGDFNGGITAGVERVIKLAEGEPMPPPPPSLRGGSGPGSDWFLYAFFAGLAVLHVLQSVLGKLGGAAVLGIIGGVIGYFTVGAAAAVAIGIGVFIASLVLGLWIGLGGGRGWGGGGFSSGGGFSGGGGGFSGGGGGFSGGGASGRW